MRDEILDAKFLSSNLPEFRLWEAHRELLGARHQHPGGREVFGHAVDRGGVVRRRGRELDRSPNRESRRHAEQGDHRVSDGVALVDPNGGVVQFLSYEGTFTATEGPANGMSSTDIGVAEDNGTTAVGKSLQLTGSGGAFTWSSSPEEPTPSVH